MTARTSKLDYALGSAVELSLWRDHLIQDEGAELLSNGLQIIDAEGVGHHLELLIWKNKKFQQGEILKLKFSCKACKKEPSHVS